MRDAVLLDQGNEIRWCIAREGGLAEVWVGGNEVVGAGMEVGEIAPAAAGYSNLLADAVRMLEHDYIACAFAGFNGTEKTRRSSTDYYDVFFRHAQENSGLRTQDSEAAQYILTSEF